VRVKRMWTTGGCGGQPPRWFQWSPPTSWFSRHFIMFSNIIIGFVYVTDRVCPKLWCVTSKNRL
jgi:hypothetical protein